MLSIIDTHVHIWDLKKQRLPWLDGESDTLNRTWVEEHYASETSQSNEYEVSKAVYIEVDIDHAERDAEAEMIIEKVQDPSSVFAGACISGDLESPEFESYITKWAQHKEIKGVRQVLHIPSALPHTCLSEQFKKNVALLGDLGLVFEACLRCPEIGDIVELAKAAPQTTIILDHMGIVDADVIAKQNPTEEEKAYQEAWKENIKSLSKLENVVCKISGLNPQEDWSVDTLRIPVEYVLQNFPADRVMYASNFPVLNVSMTFNQWTEAMLEITEGMDADKRQALFFDNANRVYKL